MRASYYYSYYISKVKLWNLCVLFIFIFTTTAFSSPPNALFESANKEFRFGNYDKSIILYQQLIDKGYRSAALYYNLGNAYYKQSNYSKAIINYERALKLNPQDDDIQFNLKLANLNTVDKIEPIPKLFYEQWWDRFINMFSIDAWSKIGIIFCWVTLFFAAVYLLSNSILLKKTGFFCGMICAVIGTLLLLVSMLEHDKLNNHKTAVIIETSAYIKSSPEVKSTNLFMLHGGTKIEIVDELQGWKKIKIANGNVGWIDEKDIEVI